MAATKRGPGAADLKAMARAFDAAVESDSKSAWATAGSKILALLRACRSAADVESVLRAHRGVFEVEGSIYPCPQAVDVLFERIASMDAKDAGRSLGWLSRCCAAPDLVVSPDAHPRFADALKDKARKAVEAHVAELRAAAGDASPERRTGGAYLLALATNATADDALRLVAAARTDANAGAAATAHLAAGVILGRLDGKGGAAARRELGEAAGAALGSKSPLTRLCAAAALADAGDSLSAAAVRAIAEHVAKPVAVPPEWGWVMERTPQPRTDSMALWLLARIRTSTPGPAIDVLVAKRVPKSSPEEAGLVRDALGHMGVEAKNGPVRPFELVAGELDADARKALGALASGRLDQGGVDGWRLLPTYAIAAMLKAKDREWEPVAIPIDGKPRRWHFNRVFASAVLGTLDGKVATRALVDHFRPDDLARLVVWPTSIYSVLDNAVSTDAAAPEREQRFAASVLSSLSAGGHDLTATFRAAVKERNGILATRVAPSILEAYPRAVPDEYLPLVADAISITGSPEPLASLLAAMPVESRRAVLHHPDANPGGVGAWRIWEANLDEDTCMKLALAAGDDGSIAPRTVEALAKGGERVARILEGLRFEDARAKSRGAPIVRQALRAIRKS
jgi:hypothetical protein